MWLYRLMLCNFFRMSWNRRYQMTSKWSKFTQETHNWWKLPEERGVKKTSSSSNVKVLYWPAAFFLERPTKQTPRFEVKRLLINRCLWLCVFWPRTTPPSPLYSPDLTSWEFFSCSHNWADRNRITELTLRAHIRNASRNGKRAQVYPRRINLEKTYDY